MCDLETGKTQQFHIGMKLHTEARPRGKEGIRIRKELQGTFWALVAFICCCWSHGCTGFYRPDPLNIHVVC